MARSIWEQVENAVYKTEADASEGILSGFDRWESTINGQKASITKREFGYVVQVNDDLITSRNSFDRARNSAVWYSKNLWDRPASVHQIRRDMEAAAQAKADEDMLKWIEKEAKKEAAAARKALKAA